MRRLAAQGNEVLIVGKATRGPADQGLFPRGLN